MTLEERNKPHKHCPICGGMFQSHRKYCGSRCVYIGSKLLTAAAKQMSRAEAIEYYGGLYDDPLRPYGRTKHKPMLREIYGYCRSHNTMTFMIPDLEEHVGHCVLPHTMGACCRAVDRSVRKTGVTRVPDVGGKQTFEWVFLLPGVLDGCRSHAPPRTAYNNPPKKSSPEQ